MEAAFRLVAAVHNTVLAGDIFWGVLLCPSACCTVKKREHSASHVLHLTSHILCSASYTPYPEPCILHPRWEPVEREAGFLASGTGCAPLVPGKLEGSQSALITGCPACLAQSQKKAGSLVSREGRHSITGRSQAPSFMLVLRKTTLSMWTGQHPWGAACPVQRAWDRDTPPLQARL